MSSLYQIVPLLNAHVEMSALSAGLRNHIRASGMPLPQDDNLLDYIAVSVRYGHSDAVLAVEDRRAVGVAAWWPEGRTGHIRLFYALPEASPEVAGDLLDCAMKGLGERGADAEVYAEIPAGPPHVHLALRKRGFVGVERLIMCVELSGQRWGVEAPPGYQIQPWRDTYSDAAAEVIYQANVGTLDAQIIPELRTRKATRKIIGQTLKGRYGDFDRQASGVALYQGDDVVAATLATRRHSGQGFTAEICVLPAHRRRGLARALMHHTHAAFAAAGLGQSMLGVTEGNIARRLYESLGYTVVGSVWTYVWPRPENWLGQQEGASQVQPSD